MLKTNITKFKISNINKQLPIVAKYVDKKFTSLYVIIQLK